MLDFKSMLMSQVENIDTEPEIRALAERLRNSDFFPNLAENVYIDALNTAIRTIEIEIGSSHTIVSDQKHVQWFDNYYKNLGISRWDRYLDYLIHQKKFPKKVVYSMQENLFKITDLLGDPTGEPFVRKGLIVGDVQSGKTANYVGLMNLATDVKYKVIIVLTGTTNSLREQTQLRIEDGLGKSGYNLGVKSIRNSEYAFDDPAYLTSFESDFNTNSRKNFQQSIETTTVPIVLVTKKNPTSLKNIYEWLSTYSKKKGNSHINSSLLLIDDEADFASVNTNEPEQDPTSINRQIRDILNLFTHNSYIGFTATPYANIFINPDDDVEMYDQDLFPKDYIYILGESEEYIGVQKIFSEDEAIATKRNMLVELDEQCVENYLKLKHKKTDKFKNMSPSMKTAVNLFFIGNTIRDIRGDTKSHRSMLLNISRFKDFHSQIRDVVLEYVEELKKDIRLYGKLPYEEAIQVPNIESLKKSYETHYEGKLKKRNYKFEDILPYLNDSVYRIKVAIFNSDEKEVDYLLNDDEGERVIVIGGFSLSRGLTLEGLMISYYYRNSVMYDSLLQMGRWFGYREGYDDLCKIFMTPKVISDFRFISLATQELKEDLETNSKKKGITPKDFGIKVRTGQAGLIITARNKMKSGKLITAKANFSKEILETTTMNLLDNDHNDKNKQMIVSFIEENKEKIVNDMYPNNNRNTFGLVDLEKIRIIEFIQNFISENTGSKYDSDLITRWLRENHNVELNNWDMAFVNGDASNTEYDFGNGIIGTTSYRKVLNVSNHKGIYKTSRSRLGSPTDGKYGLSLKQVEEIRGDRSGTISQKEYFDSKVDRKPIILVYSVIPKDIENITITLREPVVLISIGIPDLGYGKSTYIDYTVNKIYQDLEESELEIKEE